MPRRSLPRTEFFLVLLGGLGLSATAGYINTLVLSLGAPPVTHLTGSVSRFSGDIGNGNATDARMILGLVGAFFIGAAISGAVIGTSTLRIGRRYGVAIMLEAALLALAASTIQRSLIGGAMLASASAGLQNGMASSYRSLIVRTTHVTGMMTDLGFLAGQRISGHPAEPWRFAFLGSLLLAFVAGGVGGVVAHHRAGSAALWLPAIGLGACGVVHFTLRTHAVRRAASRPASERHEDA